MSETYTDNTWTAALVTVANMNAWVRDNLRFFYAGVGFAASKTAQSVASGSGVKMAFVETWDSHNYFDDVTNYRFQPLRAGKYQINATVRITNAANVCWGAILKNGVATGIITLIFVDSAADTYLSCAGVVNLNGSTDYVELHVFQGAGANRNVDAEFSGFRVGT